MNQFTMFFLSFLLIYFIINKVVYMRDTREARKSIDEKIKKIARRNK